MKRFSANVKAEDYHHFSKNALMCFHIGINKKIEKEGNLDGWWLPLGTPIMGWKGLNLVEPSQKTLVTFGTVTLNLDSKVRRLNVFFQGRQVFRGDIEGTY